jgi:tetratricopeptide (TPR) repeat protein
VLNTAARLQHVAAPGEVVAGEAAARLLRDAASLEPLAPASLRGKEHAMAASRIVAVAPAVRSPSVPFIGRDRSLEAIRRVFDDVVEDREPVLVTVVGDPGIGKSRLVDAVVASFAGATVLRASVAAAGEAAGLAAVTDLLLAAGGSDDPAVAVRALEERVDGRTDAAALGRWLRSWIGEGTDETAEAGWALRRLLEVLTDDGPVVVAIDDLHWGRPALLELVDDLVTWTRGPVLFLTAARPDLFDVRPTWAGGKPRALTLSLRPLADDHAAMIAGALLPDDATAADAVARAAEGNPLFLEQLALDARDRGGAWDPSAAPATVRALLEARLDRLDPAAARITQVAAVQGVRFDAATLRVLDPDVGDPTAALRASERAHLVVETEPDTWRFTHALIRETAYGRLPKRSRAALHARLADAIGDADDELAGLHLERAAALRAEIGNQDVALETAAGERLAKAGARAFARIDLQTSADLLGRAAALLPATSPTRQELVPDLAVALTETGRDREAETLLASAVTDAVSERHVARARLQQLAMHVYRRSTIEETRAGAEEAEALLATLHDADDDAGLAQGYTVLEYLRFTIGEIAATAEASRRAVEHAARAGRPREQIQAGGDLGHNVILGSPTVALMAERGTEMAAAEHPVLHAGGVGIVAAASGLAGDRDAYAQGEAGWLRACEEQGLEWPAAMQAMGIGVVLFELGDPARAETLIRRGLATMDRLGDLWGIQTLTALLPVALARQGRLDEAATLVEAADREPAFDIFDRTMEAIGRSEAATARDRRDEARVHAATAVDLAMRTDAVLLQTLALETAAAALDVDDPAAAVRERTRALELHRAFGNVVGVARVEAALGARS